MKRRNLISPLVLLSGLLLVMFIISCGKDGAAGPAGPKGDTGSGTVIYSEWLDVPYKPDTIHTAGGGIDTVGFYAIIDVPKLTQALLSTADVKVYINTNDASDAVIYPLPYSAASGLYIDMRAYAQKIELYSNADLSTASANGKKYQQYRYMIVPGNTQARAAAPVNWSDYAEVKAYLGLKD
ncbi:hypothetical protein [Chitinophaga sp. CF418]|uniref:hypothetical protein n=1 Tax=Chitinophaga sp. CF418 TaxID=1855287 RepID=UPI0009189996|nr:hypothetical protein [Chitinophaga sp. CF418]SHM69928.1 hypothetical protein SAMN05216311_1037 [Chitinophaga sp. CF418]